MVKILGASHGSRVCQEQDTAVQQLWTCGACPVHRYSKVVRCGHYKRPGLEPWLATWRPLVTTGDQLATYWRPTGDLATWRPTDDLLATCWRPIGDLLATTGNHWQRGTMLMHWRPLATAADHWRRGNMATWRPGDHWRLLATWRPGDRWRPLATAGDLCDP